LFAVYFEGKKVGEAYIKAKGGNSSAENYLVSEENN